MQKLIQRRRNVDARSDQWFDHLFELVGSLEDRLRAGRLNNVTPGFRQMSEADVLSFLEASSR